MSNIIENRGSPGAQLIISGDDIPFGAYQAIYHSLTRKVERRVKQYKGAYVILFSDIENIHQRLIQALKQYAVKSSRCQITHQFHDNTAREHSSFEKFKLSDLSTRACSKHFSYELDFLIVLPAEIPEAQEIAQRYKISISLGQPSADPKEIDVPFFIRGVEREYHPISVIEYADYLVSQALQSVIDGWFESLPKGETPSFYKRLNKLERPLRFYASSLIKSVTLFSGLLALGSVNNSKTAAAIILFSIATAILISTIADSLIDRLFGRMNLATPITTLSITIGDADRNNAIVRRKSRAAKAVYYLIFSVIVTVIISVFSSFLYDKIKHFVLL